MSQAIRQDWCSMVRSENDEPEKNDDRKQRQKQKEIKEEGIDSTGNDGKEERPKKSINKKRKVI